MCAKRPNDRRTKANVSGDVRERHKACSRRVVSGEGTGVRRFRRSRRHPVFVVSFCHILTSSGRSYRKQISTRPVATALGIEVKQRIRVRSSSSLASNLCLEHRGLDTYSDDLYEMTVLLVFPVGTYFLSCMGLY